MSFYSVEDSVYDANRLWGRDVKLHNIPCPRCQADAWQTRWGIDEQYASEYNPGEYCEFTCTQCGYSYEAAS
jgi:hypothetical protein